MSFILIIICVIVGLWALGTLGNYLQQRQKAKIADIERKSKEIKEEKKKVESEKQLNEQAREAIELIANEKSQGFPWLAQAFADYFHLENLKKAAYLEHKSHPAPVSAEKVREIARERRNIEEKLRIAQGVIKYYQELFPFLDEFLGDIDEDVLKKVLSRNIEEPIEEVSEIGIDPVRIYLSSLSEEQYQKLSTAERNQLALDRYWTRPKSGNGLI